MRDHADDCAISITGVCTCTVGIGQPAAQVTRKLLVEEYQRGKEIGYADGYRDGEDAAVAKMIALQNRQTIGFPNSVDNNPMTEPLNILHHRHRAEKRATHGSHSTKYERDEFDDVPERDFGLHWNDYLWVLGMALGVLLITGSLTWFFGIPAWPLWTIGVTVTAFMVMIIKLDYDNRKKHDVH